MDSLQQVTKSLTDEILKSEVYQTYQTELEKVKQYPELKTQIDEFRRNNYLLQCRADIDFDKLDHFEKEYENFRQQPLVADFLAAELALCRMMQDIFGDITEALDFE